jgi:hypothetical protein
MAAFSFLKRSQFDVPSLCLWTLVAACVFGFLWVCQREPLEYVLIYSWIALIAGTRVLFGWVASLFVSSLIGVALSVITFMPTEPPRGTRAGAALYGLLVALLMVFAFALSCHIVRFLRRLLDGAGRFIRGRKTGHH